jgi:hypothetical protein
MMNASIPATETPKISFKSMPIVTLEFGFAVPLALAVELATEVAFAVGVPLVVQNSITVCASTTVVTIPHPVAVTLQLGNALYQPQATLFTPGQVATHSYVLSIAHASLPLPNLKSLAQSRAQDKEEHGI